KKAIKENKLNSRNEMAVYVDKIATTVLKMMQLELVYCEMKGMSETDKDQYLPERWHALHSFVEKFKAGIESYKLNTEEFFHTEIKREVAKLNNGGDYTKIADDVKHMIDRIYTNDRFKITAYKCHTGASNPVPVVKFNHSNLRDENGKHIFSLFDETYGLFQQNYE
ncbi:hypothetical protein PMAYCL1PPCAC_26336, partial [Pristionchus mayeri]